MTDISKERLAECIEVARQTLESHEKHGHGRTRIAADTLAALRELERRREEDAERIAWPWQPGVKVVYVDDGDEGEVLHPSTDDYARVIVRWKSGIISRPLVSRLRLAQAKDAKP